MKKTTFQIPDDQKGGNANELDSVSEINFNKQPPKKPASSKVNTNATLASVIASNRAMLRPVYLSFKQHDIENEYAKYFVKYNLTRWQRTAIALVSILTVLYIYFMIQYSSDYSYWSTHYAPSIKGGITSGTISLFCPNGWYCSSCYPDMVCTNYNVLYDAAFWIITTLLPFVLGYFSSFYLIGSYFTEYNDLISSIMIGFHAFIGVGVRYYVVENSLSFIQPTVILIVFMFFAVYNFRMRFIYTLVTTSTISFIWILMNIPPMVLQADDIHASPRTYAIGFICLIIASGMTSFASYEIEYIHRMQFLMSKEMKKNNAKLTNQLKLLAKQYNKKAGSLDSPLERCVMVIRSVMADPVLSSQHLMALGQVLALLSSTNLLTPDLEGTLGDALDNEQEAWLFSEIAARKRGGRAKSNAAGTVTFNTSVGGSMAQMSGPASTGASASSNAIAPVVTAPAPSATNGVAAATQPASGAPSSFTKTSVLAEAAVDNGARRRTSITQEVANKIEPTIEERPSALNEEGTGEGQEDSVFAGVIGTEESKRAPKTTASGILATAAQDDPGAAYPPVLDGIAPMLTRATEYNWPIFDFTAATQQHSLTVLAHHVFSSSKLFDAFSVPRDKFRNFIRTIERGYHADLPYHNSIHATDVLHCMYFLSNDEKIKQISSELELFAMYLAAIIHDHDHPGLNNNFLVNTSDPKAVLYNDKSVLENHHAASSFNILLQTDNNFMSHMSKADYKSVREIAVDLVLATDLTQHFTLLSMFKTKVANSEAFDPYETREDRMLLYKIMIKCSDVSNPTKDMSLYEPWCRLILEEFYRQGDMEKRMGIPVSPYMDRDTANVPSSQIGFIDYVVMPLFDALDKFLPIPSVLSRLQKNREYWAQLKAQGILSLPPTGSVSVNGNLSASATSSAAPASNASAGQSGLNASTNSSGTNTSHHNRLSSLPRSSHTQSQIISGSKSAISMQQQLLQNQQQQSQQLNQSHSHPQQSSMVQLQQPAKISGNGSVTGSMNENVSNSNTNNAAVSGVTRTPSGLGQQVESANQSSSGASHTGSGVGMSVTHSSMSNLSSNNRST